MLNPRDLNFLLYEWLDVESLTQRERYAEHSRETFDAVLDLGRADRHRACSRRTTARPTRTSRRSTATARRPDPRGRSRRWTRSAQPGCSAGDDRRRPRRHAAAARRGQAAVRLVPGRQRRHLGLRVADRRPTPTCSSRHGTDRARSTPVVRPMLEGRFFGTMCLSEPQAGSSLADITTRAEPPGRRHLPAAPATRCGSPAATTSCPRTSSTWCWPRSPGGAARRQGHLAVHRARSSCVGDDGRARRAQRRRARRAQPQDGLPRHRQHAAQLRRGDVHARMASRGGRLPGRRARTAAWRCMFHMMNEARIGVGLGATALGYTGYLHVARLRARTRPQGRPVGRRKDPGRPAGPDHRARRRAADAAGAEGLRRGRARAGPVLRAAGRRGARRRRVRETGASARLLLEVLTPIAKSWPSQWCLEANDLAIQVHGGYGYTRDYDVEQLYRDNRLNPIHEGTHGIQALDLLGRKVVDGRRRGRSDAAGRARSRATGAARDGDRRAGSARRKRCGGRVAPAASRSTAALWAHRRSRDARSPTRRSTSRPPATSCVAWMWLEQAAGAAHGKAGDFYDGKRRRRATSSLRAAEDRRRSSTCSPASTAR